MGKTLGELETGMSWAELQRWKKFFSVEPWGAYRDNMHAGIIAAAAWGPHIKKGKKGPTWKDFILKDPATAQKDRAAATPRTFSMLKAMAVRKPNGK